MISRSVSPLYVYLYCDWVMEGWWLTCVSLQVRILGVRRLVLMRRLGGIR